MLLAARKEGPARRTWLVEMDAAQLPVACGNTEFHLPIPHHRLPDHTRIEDNVVVKA